MLVKKTDNMQKNKVIDFQEVFLDKKNSFYYSYDDFSPIISIDLAFKDAGYALDSEDKLGISYLALYFLKNFEITKNPEEFKKLIEKKGIKISFHIDQENFYVSIKTVSKYFKDVQKILTTILSNKVFNESFLENSKNNLSQIYAINKGNSNFLVEEKMAQDVFADSDLAKNPYGDIETHKNIKTSDLSDFISNRFRNNNINMAIAGDIKEKDALKLYKNINDNLSDKAGKSYKNFHLVKKPQDSFVSLDKDQILIRAYIPSTGKNNHSFYKSYIANYIIGGSGLNSILSRKLREEQGLTYSAYSYFDNYNDFSLWIGEFSTDKKNYEKALKIFKETLTEIYEKGITSEELEMAKKYLKGSFAINFSSNEKVTSYLLDNKLKLVPEGFLINRNHLISSYDKEEINKEIKKIFNPEYISYIVVGADR